MTDWQKEYEAERIYSDALRQEINHLRRVLAEYYEFVFKIKHDIRDFITRDGVQTRRPIKDDGLRIAPPRSSDTV